MKYLNIFILSLLFALPSFSQNCGFKAIESAKIDEILRGANGGTFLRKAITIPVIIHVLAHPTDEVVSDATIFSQINVLNRDFNAKNGDLQNVPVEFKDKIGNVGIRFCLITQDAMGNPHSGIIRVKRR